MNLTISTGYVNSMTRVRSPAIAIATAAVCASLCAAALFGSASAQSTVVDEGAFRIIRGSGNSPEVESFRILRGAASQLVATGRLSAGTRLITSRLVADSVGGPIQYLLVVTEKGVKTAEVQAAAAGGRLRTVLSNQRGDESDRDYPVGHDRTVILDDDLVHQLYFSGLSGQSGAIRVISPHAARAGTYEISAHGLEPIEVGGQTVTATHLALANGADRRDFWVDSNGRVLKVETSSGVKAVRDELPRNR